MKQVLQSLKNGETSLAEVPVPKCSKGYLLIETSKTLVSTGTERMLVEFGKAGWLGKARQQPEKVKDVLDKIKTDGLYPTIEAVFNKLEQPLPLGYCNIGRVIEIGEDVTGFEIGDRVISNGKHAEVVTVPVNLCAKVPDTVSDEDAAFTVLASIALQGIRLIKPTLGEAIVVTGLGLVGLLTVQLLRANGCRVLGLDYDKKKLELAHSFGAEVVDLTSHRDPVAFAQSFSRSRGVDAVIITAATQSNKPVHQAAQMCRQRGRVVLVGVAGLELSREEFFKKELKFQVSASYGPGRYDPNYEEKGNDYPIGYVRWTEQRNFEAVLDMMAANALSVSQIISHKFRIHEAIKAYNLVFSDKPSLGILLEYPGLDKGKISKTISFESLNLTSKTNPKRVEKSQKSGAVQVSFIGCGNYANSVLIPSFKSAGATLLTAASISGDTSAHSAKKFKFSYASTDIDSLFTDPANDALVISTRHNSHAKYISQGLLNNKSIFVEKPLCITLKELKKIEVDLKSTYENNVDNPILMVGFNRRFSPHCKKIKSLLAKEPHPKSFIFTVNAGFIPSNHWIQDKELGGGRIIGECCHFIDLIRHLADSPITSFDKNTMNCPDNDTITINLKFKDGSIGTIHYFANGSKAFPKERLEIFSSGKILQLDNFRKLRGFNWPGFKKMDLWRQDKGQAACTKEFLSAVKEKSPSPVPISEIFEVARVTIQLSENF